MHPESKKEIIRKKGIKNRPDYLTHNKKNYSIPKEFDEKEITLEDAMRIINEKKTTKRKRN